MSAETKKSAPLDPAREKALSDYRKKLVEHREVEAKLKTMREELKTLTKQVRRLSGIMDLAIGFNIRSHSVNCIFCSGDSKELFTLQITD
jgi:hypothetical protein